MIPKFPVLDMSAEQETEVEKGQDENIVKDKPDNWEEVKLENTLSQIESHPASESTKAHQEMEKGQCISSGINEASKERRGVKRKRDDDDDHDIEDEREKTSIRLHDTQGSIKLDWVLTYIIKFNI